MVSFVYDVLVVGAGIIGCSTAYHIKREDPSLKVLLVDKYGAAGQGNTARSAACFRNFFYSETNFLLADSSVSFYMDLQSKGVDLKLKAISYLFLLSGRQYERLKPVIEEMGRRGLEYKVYDAGELEEKIGLKANVTVDEEARELGLEDIEVGVQCIKAGELDPELLVKYYEKEYRDLGGEVMYNTEVKRLLFEPEEKLGMPGEPYPWQRAKVAGADTTKGEIRADMTIVAAGAWSYQLLDPLGVDCLTKPKKRQVFVISAKSGKLADLLRVKGFNEEGCLPMTILPNGIYVRPNLEEISFWVGLGDELGRAFKLEEDPQPEEDFYSYGIYPVLSKYMPHFGGARPASAFAGLYAVNSLDAQPVVLKEPGLIVATGLSGSGIMKADAVGRIAAALYFGREEAELYGGGRFKVGDLSLSTRRVQRELFVI
ncbi:MAG: FAD-binding oxidoreductase [Thermoproteota archaeon]|nr:MAG: FAD-binding oxidoreductase [Candidatus Korarchaeota archaeon]